MVLRFSTTNRLTYTRDAYETRFLRGIPVYMSNIQLLENGDTHVDGYAPENAGLFLRTLKTHGFLQENAETIHMNVVTMEVYYRGGMTMKNKWVSFIVNIICFPVVWCLLDYLYNTLITKEPFQFKIVGNLIIPVIVAAVFGYFTYIRKKDEKKDQ